MRIVSLVPAATDWLEAFGAGERIVGRFDGEKVDTEALRELKPDLVVAPHDAALVEPDDIVAFDPQTFKQVLDAALRLGRAAGCLPEAMRVIGDGERRLRDLHAHLGRRRDGSLADRPTPTVAVLERLDPLTTAGRWMPDLIALAGGQAVCAEAGTSPVSVAWESLRATDPDVLVIAAQSNLQRLTERSGWSDLRAVRSGRVYRFGDGAALHRPGPSLYRAVELLAALLHPDLFGSA